jgi:hypothetical protein
MNYTLADGQASCSSTKCKRKFNPENVHSHNIKTHQGCCVRIVGIEPIRGGYECDYEDGPCVCPYDERFVQTFDTFSNYKTHMAVSHACPAMQKRRTRKPCSKYLIQKRRDNAIDQHNSGKFLNTHVKKETLLDFIRIYDDFIQDLFGTIGRDAQSLQRVWNRHLRIRPSDLEVHPLEDMVFNMKEVYTSRARRRALEDDHFLRDLAEYQEYHNR